jgi:hypothetical protein
MEVRQARTVEETPANKRIGWFTVLTASLFWLLVLAGCTGLFALVIEWWRNIIPIGAP